MNVYSDVVPLSELTALLGEPARGHDLGDVISPGNPRSGVYKSNFWCLESSAEKVEGLDVHIEELVRYVESNRAAFDEVRDSCWLRIFCGLFTGDDAMGGFDLKPDLIKRLADLDLEVGFDVY